MFGPCRRVVLRAKARLSADGARSAMHRLGSLSDSCCPLCLRAGRRLCQCAPLPVHGTASRSAATLLPRRRQRVRSRVPWPRSVPLTIWDLYP